MADIDRVAVPVGMLRVTKEGEQDRVIYPVHADGWRALGWTVHLPELSLDEEDMDEQEDGDEEDGEALAVDAASPTPRTAVEEEEGAPQQPGTPEPVLPPDLESMTKAQIIAFCSATYGVELDGSQTKGQLVAQALDLATAPAASAEDTGGDGNGDDDGALVPDLLI